MVVAQAKVDSTLRDLEKKFKYYRLSFYTYSLASLMEIMLSGNFKEEYISGMTKTKALSAAEQSQVRADIVQKIQDINAKLNEDGVRDSRDQCIEKFIICETAYKIVLKKYLQVNNKYDSDGKMRIQLTQVNTALKNAGYTLDEGLMERLFSGSGNYTVSGQKSAKVVDLFPLT
jgi:hypothetical protein